MIVESPGVLGLRRARLKLAILAPGYMLSLLRSWRMIVRKPNKQDRRVVTIELTEKGKSIAHQGIEILVNLPDALKGRLNANELNTIRQLENYHCENEATQITAAIS